MKTGVLFAVGCVISLYIGTVLGAVSMAMRQAYQGFDGLDDGLALPDQDETAV